MLVDNSLILDNNFALTTTGSSTNYIDTVGAAGGQAQISGINTIQGGYDAYVADWFEAVITQSMTGGGISLSVQLWTAAAIANIWTTGNGGSAPTVSTTLQTYKLLDSGSFLAASLVGPASGKSSPSGTVLIKARIPVGCQRFISAFYTTVGTFTGGGTISALIVPDVDINLT
jgi:hypothetical protein